MVQRALGAPESSFFLLGPRGTGKTTWIGQRFPAATVYDLLRPDEHVRLARDPSAFGRECTPDSPLGATMVSAEGACAAYFAYGRHLPARRLRLAGEQGAPIT